MIVLDVESYCHECPGFKAEVRTESGRYDCDMSIVTTTHYVTCAYRKRCDAMMKYLKKHSEKEK